MLNWKNGKSVAIVSGGKYKNKILRMDHSVIPEEIRESGNKDYFDEIKLTSGYFKPYPDDSKSTSRECLYVAGPSGSGKSTYCSNYLKAFRNLNPDRDVIVFSQVDDDEVYKNKKLKAKKIEISNDLLEDPIDINTDFAEGPCIIFDDTNTIREKKLREEIMNVRDTLLETGRHLGCTTICTNHQLMDYARTRTLLNEAHLVTFFPASGAYHIKRFLKEYCGLDKKTIQRVMKLRSRWVTVSKNYPPMCFCETEAFMLR